MNMSNDRLLDVMFKSLSALEVIEKLGAQAKLPQALGLLSVNPEQAVMAIKFLKDSLKDEDLDAQMEKRAIASFYEATEEAVKLAEIAKGYQEMGEINLQIAQEDFHLEQEGAGLHEVDTKKAQGGVQ